MLRESTSRGAVVFATGMEEYTISRHFAPQQSSTLLEYVLDSVWTVADDLLVVFKREPKLSLIETISPFGVKVLTVGKDRNQLMSVADAFKASRSEYCLLVSERVPLLKPNVVLHLFNSAVGFDGAVPKWKDGRIEPVVSVYRKNTFIRIVNSTRYSSDLTLERALSKITEQFFDLNFVSIEGELSKLDPELDSFLEVKDEKGLQGARRKASVRSKGGLPRN
jgi:molybdopterin-guanine dinucleotide biosynthesis protein A